MHIPRSLLPRVPVSRFLWIALMMVLLASAGQVGAQICAEPANRTLNCGFDSDISGWVVHQGLSPVHSTDGNEAAGSFQIESQSGMGHATTIGQCIGGLAGVNRLNYGAWFKITSGFVWDCSIGLMAYGDDNCTTSGEGYHETYSGVGPDWRFVGGQAQLAPGVAGFRFFAYCYSYDSPFTVRMDDIFLGEDIGPFVFEDGFETGNTTLWSATVS